LLNLKKVYIVICNGFQSNTKARDYLKKIFDKFTAPRSLQNDRFPPVPNRYVRARGWQTACRLWHNCHP